MDNILQSFELHETLNPEIWDNVDSNIDEIKLKPEIRIQILNIAKDFVESFELPEMEIEDILIVGSLSNYNWSKFSDIDIHVVIDKQKLHGDIEIIDQLFDAKKAIFNLKHDITIKNYDVELYGQDINEKVDADGIYSVLYKKWVKTPTNDPQEFDKTKILKKVKEFYTKLNAIKSMGDSPEKVKMIKDLREKIRKYRKIGLQQNGEYSTENLVFKYLRRSGYMDTISDLAYQTKDSIYSIDELEF